MEPDADDRPIPLRERQRLALRAEIQQTALRLFATHGYDQVTTEAIAEAVGISPSTFFRHVPTKEQLLLGATQRGRAQILARFHERPDDEDAAASVAAAILARTSQFVDDDEWAELWRRAMASAPLELRRASLLSREERDELIAAVARRLGRPSRARQLQAGVLVRSLLAAVEYAYELWLADDGGPSLHDLTGRALDLARHGFEETAPRRRPSRAAR